MVQGGCACTREALEVAPICVHIGLIDNWPNDDWSAFALFRRARFRPLLQKIDQTDEGADFRRLVHVVSEGAGL